MPTPPVVRPFAAALLGLAFPLLSPGITHDFQVGYAAGSSLNGQPASGTTWTRFTSNSSGDQSLLIAGADLPKGQHLHAVNAGASGGFRYAVSADDLVPGGGYSFSAASALVRYHFNLAFDSVHSTANANAIGLVRIGDTTNATLYLELVADGRLRYSTYDSGTAAIQQLYVKNAAGNAFYATAGTTYRVQGVLDYATDRLTLVVNDVPQPAYATGDGWTMGFRNPAATDNDWIVNTLNVGTAYYQPWTLDDLNLTARPTTANAVNVAGSGWIDVTQAPYYADNTGATDATNAIQAAISDNVMVANSPRTLYFPNGTYKITSTLEWRDNSDLNAAYLTLQGQSRDGVILQVPDNTPYFQQEVYPDPNPPPSGWIPYDIYPAVIFVRSLHNPAWYGTDPNSYTYQVTEARGEGHRAFHNNIRNLTIDVGDGNTHAIGIDYHASNQGVLENVRLVAGSNSGLTGLRLDRANVGPGLVKNVTIEGFATGINSRSQYVTTLEHITLSGQSTAGISNTSAVLAIRGLRSTNSVPAIFQNGAEGLVCLLDSELMGGSATDYGIDLASGFLYARNVLAGGYAGALIQGSTPTGGAYLGEYSSAGVGSVSPSLAGAIRLPVEETPIYYDSNTANWALVTAYGANPHDTTDDTAAIQSALDSGKSTIFFPAPTGSGGSYRVTGTLTVPATVRHIDGNWADIRAVAGSTFAARDGTAPLFEVAAAATHPLIIERFTLRGEGFDLYAPGILHTSPRDLAIKHGILPWFRNGPGAGRLFLEDISNHEDGETYRIDYPQQVWARQLNPEQYQHTKLLNNGGRVWVLGFKNERPSTLFKTVGYGQTEVYGAINYQNHELPDDVPIIASNNGSQSLVFATHLSPNNRLYKTLLQETRHGTTNTLLTSQAPARGALANSTAYSLFSGAPTTDWNPTAKPVVRVDPPATGINEGSTGEFTVTRTGGDLGSALTVNFTVSGSATAGSDYSPLGTSVTIPANSRSAAVPLTTLNAGGDEVTETVVLTLDPSGDYLIGHPGAAAANLWDPVAATKAGTLPSTERILWLRADGRVLRDAQDRVTFWRDETTQGNHAYNRESDRAPLWTANSISGRPALRFQERQLFLPKTESFQSGSAYPERSLLIALQTGIDVASRQSIYEEGGNGRGFGVYLKDGYIYAGAWHAGNWELFMSAPAESNRRYLVELYYKEASDLVEFYLNGDYIDSLGGITTAMTAHNDQSTLGGAFSSALYADLNEPRKLGGYYFKGRLHEIVVHNATLNNKLRDKARKYFLPKYITGAPSQEVPQITVSEPDFSPKFYSASAGLTLNFSASVTTQSGGSVSVQWVQLTGDAITWGTPTATSTTATFPGAGVYRFKFIADDGDLANEAVRTVVIE